MSGKNRSPNRIVALWALLVIAATTGVLMAVVEPTPAEADASQHEFLRGWNSHVFTLNISGWSENVYVFCGARAIGRFQGDGEIDCFQIHQEAGGVAE